MPSDKHLTFSSVRNFWFWISMAAVVVSITVTAIFGLNLGIDFTGGSSIQVKYAEERPSNDQIVEDLTELDLGEIVVQPADELGAVIKTRHISDQERQDVLAALGNPEEQSFSSIGPTIGAELQEKALLAIAIVLLAIIGYISWAFRGVSTGPVKSWVYGIGAILALVHDIVITVGIFAILGLVFDVQVDTLFVTALLTILGFSVHDTIVVYDRIRETLKRNKKDKFEKIVSDSVRGTIVRSLNTSITTALVLLTLLLFGGDSTFYFVLALIIGIISGTYSSIFVASPLLVLIARRQSK